MKVNNPKIKEEIIRRLRRIEGQVRGVQRMVDEDRDCQEIVQQLSSIRSAVHSANLIFMREYISDCLLKPPADEESDRQESVSNIIDLLSKLS